MSVVARLGLVASTVAVLAAGAPARAQFTPTHLVLGTSPGCIHVPACSSGVCTGPMLTCSSLTSTAGATSGPLCVAPLDIYCCGDATECPLLPVRPGTSISCLPLTSGGVDTGICDYGDPLCLGASGGNDLEHIRHCLDARQCMTPSPLFAPGPWAMGDCDCDGVLNGAEPRGGALGDSCLCDSGATCPAPLDAGVPDAGGLDLGTVDLGLPDLGAVDLGAVDLGVPVDLGPAPDLGAPPGEDAGDVPVDAGSVAMDAAAAPPGTSFRGAGGCVCGVARGREPGAWWLGGVVALVAARRLRRRAA